MRISTTLLRLGLSSIVSVSLWLMCREPIGSVVRGVVVATAHACGEQVHDPGGGRVALVVAHRGAGAEKRARIYGSSLLRWHVNLIAVPILAIAFGGGFLRRRLLVTAVALLLLVALDGGSLFAYLWLGARRLRDTPLVSVAFDEHLTYGIAVYGVRVMPIVAWGAASLALRRGGDVKG